MAAVLPAGLILENRINLFGRTLFTPKMNIIHSRNQDVHNTESRLFGASVFIVPSVDSSETGKNTKFHPWLCSLRTRGFRGGVTLLSDMENKSSKF